MKLVAVIAARVEMERSAGHLFCRQRMVDCAEIVVLVFAHQDPRRQQR